MGRPINKRYFKSGDGKQIGIRAKIGTNAEGSGFIISQRSNKKFKVQVGNNVGVCTVVDKPDGSLSAGEMTISVVTDAGTTVRVKKLTNRAAWPFAGGKTHWTFAASTTDNKVQVLDATDPAVIVITAHPADVTVTAPNSAQFSVTAEAVGYTLKYKWQVSTNAGATWTTISGATSSTYTVTDSTGLNGNRYRVQVSAKGLTSVESNAATLTVV